MHAVLVEVELEAARSGEAEAFLRNELLPMVRQAPGFVSGTWTRSEDGIHGRSMVIYDDQESAKAAASRAAQGPPPGVPVRFVSAEVFESRGAGVGPASAVLWRALGPVPVAAAIVAHSAGTGIGSNRRAERGSILMQGVRHGRQAVLRRETGRKFR
jgi:hypothetical protein